MKGDLGGGVATVGSQTLDVETGHQTSANKTTATAREPTRSTRLSGQETGRPIAIDQRVE